MGSKSIKKHEMGNLVIWDQYLLKKKHEIEMLVIWDPYLSKIIR